jgi:hypothetical protein
MDQKEISRLTDSEIKREIFQRLAQGVLPFEQWVHVFANLDLARWPGLRILRLAG